MSNKESGNFFGVEQREASQKIGEDKALGKAERIEAPKKILEIQAEGENMGNIILPTYVDSGRYLGSISTFYRILRKAGQVIERRNIKRHANYIKPELMATAPNQVWSWDISYLKSLHKGIHYYLYVIIDIYSRYVVGWMIAENESSFSANRLMIETCQNQNINQKNIKLHSDRGSVMKSLSKIKKLKEMRIDFSFSRPHVSNDNPFSESQF